MQDERTVGGISCSQVLAELSDYLDGGLSDAERAQIETHVQGCDRCESFGATFGEAVRTLRARLAETEDVDPEIAQRLLARLEKL